MAGIDFRTERNREFINEIAEQLNKEDENWGWSVPIIREKIVCLYWGYLDACFVIRYDEETDSFSALNEEGEDITEDLEDNIDLKATMRSVFLYATNRY